MGSEAAGVRERVKGGVEVWGLIMCSGSLKCPIQELTFFPCQKEALGDSRVKEGQDLCLQEH